MKKGITPIIAIIILLLITIGLAATAWTYLSGFLVTYTKSLTLVDSYCAGGVNATVIMRNSGTEAISVGSCTSFTGGTSQTCGALTITRTDGNPFSNAGLDKTGTLGTQQMLTFTDVCTTAGTPRVCTYRFSTGVTGATQVPVTCG
jgi:flagellin-like protein